MSANVKAESVLVGFGQAVGDARRVDQVYRNDQGGWMMAASDLVGPCPDA